jgi:hypothetical protein
VDSVSGDVCYRKFNPAVTPCAMRNDADQLIDVRVTSVTEK